MVMLALREEELFSFGRVRRGRRGFTAAACGRLGRLFELWQVVWVGELDVFALGVDHVTELAVLERERLGQGVEIGKIICGEAFSAPTCELPPGSCTS